MGDNLYVQIWQACLPWILSTLESGNADCVQLEQSYFKTAGSRIRYSFRLDINNAIVPLKEGNATARDLKEVLDGSAKFKRLAKGKQINIHLDSHFVLHVW